MNRDSIIVKADRLIQRMPAWLILLLCLLWKIICDVTVSTIVQGPVREEEPSYDFFHIFIALLCAPVVETFLFQMLPIEGFIAVSKKFTGKKYPVFAAIFSAILFGSAHSYSVLFAIMTCFSGLSLSFSYLVFSRRRRSALHGYAMTLLLHFIVNLLVVVVNVI